MGMLQCDPTNTYKPTYPCCVTKREKYAGGESTLCKCVEIKLGVESKREADREGKGCPIEGDQWFNFNL